MKTSFLTYHFSSPVNFSLGIFLSAAFVWRRTFIQCFFPFLIFQVPKGSHCWSMIAHSRPILWKDSGQNAVPSLSASFTSAFPFSSTQILSCLIFDHLGSEASENWSALKLTPIKLGQLSVFLLTYMCVQNLGLAWGDLKGDKAESFCGSAALLYLQLFQELPCWYNAFNEACTGSFFFFNFLIQNTTKARIYMYVLNVCALLWICTHIY